MTDDARINDVIQRLEKIAETFEKRCSDINTHLEDHSKRIVTLEVIHAQTEKIEVQRPQQWQGYAAIVGVFISIATLISVFVIR